MQFPEEVPEGPGRLRRVRVQFPEKVPADSGRFWKNSGTDSWSLRVGERRVVLHSVHFFCRCGIENAPQRPSTTGGRLSRGFAPWHRKSSKSILQDFPTQTGAMWLAPTGKRLRLQLWLKGVTGAPEPVGMAEKSIQTGASEH